MVDDSFDKKNILRNMYLHSRIRRVLIKRNLVTKIRRILVTNIHITLLTSSRITLQRLEWLGLDMLALKRHLRNTLIRSILFPHRILHDPGIRWV